MKVDGREEGDEGGKGKRVASPLRHRPCLFSFPVSRRASLVVRLPPPPAERRIIAIVITNHHHPHRSPKPTYLVVYLVGRRLELDLLLEPVADPVQLDTLGPVIKRARHKDLVGRVFPGRWDKEKTR